MTATAAASRAGARTGRRRLPWWLFVVAGVVGLGLVLGAPADGGTPLDPDNPSPIGAKALFATLESFGAEVDRVEGPPTSDHDTAVVLFDVFDDDTLDGIVAWVEDGGTLLVADPNSVLMPSAPVVEFSEGLLVEADDTLARECSGPFPALDGVAEVSPAGSTLFRQPRGGVGCFGDPDGEGYFVVAAPRGEGTVVGLGGAGPLTNEHIDEADNAALVVSIVAPSAGTRVALVRPPETGGGERTLSDLVPDGVKQGLLQLAIAFVFVVLWRSRQLSRPVREPQPVQLAGSELVVAVGNLLQQARQRDQAASHLRDSLHRTVCERLGLPLTMPREQLVDAVVSRTGLDRSRVAEALLPTPVSGDAGLLSLAQTADAVRQEVAHA